MPCGRCGKHLALGVPVMVLTLPGVTRQLFRGTCCTPGDPPPDLPDLPVRSRVTQPMRALRVPTRAVVQQHFEQAAKAGKPWVDGRMRQTGEEG
jgi:hypothetical protein